MKPLIRRALVVGLGVLAGEGAPAAGLPPALPTSIAARAEPTRLRHNSPPPPRESWTSGGSLEVAP